MCDGSKSVGEISEGLAKKLDAPANEDLVWLAIDQLKKEKLIANGQDLLNNFEGMNRREVIKKIGLASMIALPIVAGMVAPTPAMAASGGIAPGAFVGSTSTVMENCGGDPTSQGNRQTRCNNVYGSQCASGMATFAPGTCAGAGPSTFDCNCA